MKLADICEVQSYIKPSAFDRSGTEMKYPNVFNKRWADVGARTKTRPETVVYRDTKTGKIYGRRTIVQKKSS